jgi:hypothetical protein
MGLKCRNCSLIGHEHCLQSSQHNLNECSGSSLILVNSAAFVVGETTSWTKSHDESGECSREAAKNGGVGGQQSVSHLSQLAQLDTSSYSVQTSSSCSTTPNSNYSQTTSSNQVGANNNNGGGGVPPQTTLNFQQHQYHGCKLDTDIGSACGMGLIIFLYHPTTQKKRYKQFF